MFGSKSQGLQQKNYDKLLWNTFICHYFGGYFDDSETKVPKRNELKTAEDES